MGFLEDPRFPSRGLGMGIFHFGLDQKIPGDEDRELGIPKNPKLKIPLKVNKKLIVYFFK